MIRCRSGPGASHLRMAAGFTAKGEERQEDAKETLSLFLFFYQPLTKRGNDAIGGGFNDDPLWLVLAAA